MFPTHPAMLDAAAPEAAVKPKPIAADGEAKSAPKVRGAPESSGLMPTGRNKRSLSDLGLERRM